MPRSKSLGFGTNWKDFYHPRQDNDPYDNRFTLIQYGPRYLALRETPEIQYGPAAFTAAHPELFATGTTSEPEGWFYWGCLQVRGEPGPLGGWQYQKQVRPGGARVGSATVDFVFTSRPRDIACRIVTPYFHTGFGPEKEGSDAEQVFSLQESGYDVVDAFSELYMGDPSGAAVKRTVEMVLQRDSSLVPGSSTYLGV